MLGSRLQLFHCLKVVLKGKFRIIDRSLSYRYQANYWRKLRMLNYRVSLRKME